MYTAILNVKPVRTLLRSILIPCGLTILVAGLVGGCSDKTEPQVDGPSGLVSGTLSGQVSYRERIRLSPEAELEVKLEKILEGEGQPAKVKTIARFHKVLGDLSPPYQFELDYSLDTAKGKARYNLHAEIKQNEQPRFVSATRLDPFSTEPDAPISIVVVGAQKGSQSLAQAKASIKAGDTAGLISGQTWVLATVRGNVPRVLNPLDPSLLPTMRFNQQSSVVSGFSGCNRFTGGYTLTGDQIKFGMMTSTMMACGGDEQVEQAFLAGLKAATQVKFDGTQLFLLSADAEELLVMSAASN